MQRSVSRAQAEDKPFAQDVSPSTANVPQGDNAVNASADAGLNMRGDGKKDEEVGWVRGEASLARDGESDALIGDVVDDVDVLHESRLVSIDARV